MPRIAVIEDDPVTRESFVRWLREGVSQAEIVQCESLVDAEQSLKATRFDLIVLDIELGIKRHAGIELMKLIDHLVPTPPVLVVSGLPPEHYRGVTKALGAWDFLQKPCQAHDLVDTAVEALSDSDYGSMDSGHLKLDPLNQSHLLWKGQKVNVTLTGMRLLNLLVKAKGRKVTYQELFDVVRSGKSIENIRKHISEIRRALRDVDPHFDCIKTVPQLGFMWIDS